MVNTMEAHMGNNAKQIDTTPQLVRDYVQDAEDVTDGPQGVGCRTWEEVSVLLTFHVRGGFHGFTIPEALVQDWEAYVAAVGGE